MVTRQPANRDLVDRAHKALPGGNLGNLELDLIVREGRGGRVWDVDGNEYVDFILGSGPMLVGHSHPEVVAAVHAQLARGTTFFATNEPAILLAEEIVRAVPCADKVRFTSSGSEATHYAMRVARAHRRCDKVIKFEGGFHGMGDYALMSMGPQRPGNFPRPVPDSAGIPAAVADTVLIAPFNDAETALGLIEEHHDELAAVIVEPFQRLMPPAPGFLEALRKGTDRYEVPLIFDEVVTGFRFAYGGAQEYYGVVPDLCALGKVIGGGFPLAAVAGRDHLMAHFDRSSAANGAFLPQIGTLSGNPVAAVAGLATLEILRRPGAYEQIFETGRTLMAGLKRLLDEASVASQVIGECPLFDVVFTSHPVVDYRSSLKGDAARLKRFNQLLLEAGVLKGQTKFYVSLAHDEQDVETTLEAFAHAVAEIVAE